MQQDRVGLSLQARQASRLAIPSLKTACLYNADTNEGEISISIVTRLPALATVTVLSQKSSRDAMRTCFEPLSARTSYTSSDKMRKSFSLARLPISRNSCSENTLPDGLCGAAKIQSQ